MKRGLAHIEMILAFVLFIGFLIFGLYFFNPIDTTRVLDTSLAYAADEIQENVTTSLIVFGVSLNESLEEEYMRLSLSAFERPSEPYGVRLENLDGERLLAYREDTNVYFKREGASFIRLYIGMFPDQQDLGARSDEGDFRELGISDYITSSSEERHMVSEERILVLQELYENDYRGFKEAFNLPQRVEVGFRLVFSPTESIVAEQQVPESVEVFSQIDRIELVRTTSEITFADLIVTSW